MLTRPDLPAVAGAPPAPLTLRGPRPPSPGVIARAFGDRRVELLVVGLAGAELDAVVEAMRDHLQRFAAVVRPLEASPVGHPDQPSGFYVIGLDLADVPRTLAGIGRGLSWSGGTARVMEGRWS